MLRTTTDLQNYAIAATDGLIGQVKDVYFDDEQWVVRYLVVETGSWLATRKVLISPIAIEAADRAARVITVSLTRDQVQDSPDIDTDEAVSRQQEEQYLRHYDYSSPRADDSSHLRRGREIIQYRLQATDGNIGHVGDLLLEEKTWAVRYLVVETGHWWLGHQVLIAPQWIDQISWPDRRVSVNVTRQAVKRAPAYHSAVPPSRAQEIALYEHHDRPGYWASEVRLENPEFHAITHSSHQ